MIPDAALVRNGDHTFAWRIKGGKLSKTSLVIGERDSRRGDFVVQSGLADGDQVVRNPLSSLRDALLPRLLSGEIRLEHGERELAAAV